MTSYSSHGSHRSERAIRCFEDGYFQPDRMSFTELLVQGRHLAAELKLAGAQGKDDSWQSLFDNDDLVVLAAIHSCDIQELNRRFNRAMDGGLGEGAFFIFELFVDINQWLKRTPSDMHDSSHNFDLILDAVVRDRLVSELHRLGPILFKSAAQSGTDRYRLLSQHLLEFENLWAIELTQEANIPVRIRFPLNDVPLNGAYSANEKVVKQAYSRVLSVLRYLQAESELAWGEVLNNQKHDPAFGLYASFLQLYSKVQNQLNSLTQKHIDFYYRDVLKNAPRPATPASVYVTVQPSPTAQAITYLQENDLFSGGASGTAEILYKLEHATTITDARVAKLKTLGFLRSKKVAPERQFQYVTHIKERTIEIDSTDTDVAAVPLFGVPTFVDRAEAIGVTSVASEVNARYGFAIASPVLHLAQGRRQIELSLYLREDYEHKVSPKDFILPTAKIDYGRLFSFFLENDVSERAHFAAYKPSARKEALLYRAGEIFDTLPTLLVGELDASESKPKTEHFFRTYLLARLFNEVTADAFLKEFGRVLRRYLLMRDAWLSDEHKLLLLLRARELLLDNNLLDGQVQTDSLITDAVKNLRSLTLAELNNSLTTALLNENFTNVVRAAVSESQREQVDSYDWLRINLFKNKERLFYEWMKNVFVVQMTGASGWLTIDNCFVRPVHDTVSSVDMGLGITLTLAEEMEAIVGYDSELHGDNYLTREPVVSFLLNEQAQHASYSILQGLCLKRVLIDVNVQGITDLVVYNQFGRLDSSKPFLPFGPLPTTSAYLIFGNAEMSKKKVSDLSLTCQWADLPNHQDGFADHYRDYARIEDAQPWNVVNSDFTVQFDVLSNNRWRTLSSADEKSVMEVPLFDSLPGSLTLDASRKLDFKVGNLHRPYDVDLSNEPFDFTPNTRHGFFKLRISQPEFAFGHNVYPELLTHVLTYNARHKKPKPLPKPPYTPSLSSLSLAYRANDRIDFYTRTRKQSEPATTERHVSKKSDQFFHISAFGVEPINPIASGQGATLISSQEYDGNLYIGISASQLGGNLNLYFDLTDDSELEVDAATGQSDIHWHYLTLQGWRQLPPERIIADTSAGFVTSGIVVIDVPDDMSSSHPVVNDNLFWFRISCSQQFSRFGSLRTVVTHGLRLVHAEGAAIANDAAFLPEKWLAKRSVAGLGAIRSRRIATAGRDAETNADMRMRLAERLRHKQRASTVWDFEKMVLQAFPNVNMVKCMNHVNPAVRGISPGHITIAVVPAWSHCTHARCSGAKLSSADLKEIYQYLVLRSVDDCQLHVLNPIYERIQVRCAVQFTSNGNRGYLLKKLNSDISDYLCPWTEQGGLGHFDWKIKTEELESYLSHLPYVSFITDFSILRVVLDEGTAAIDDDYLFSDSAEITERLILPSYRWSLPVPCAKHFITVIDQQQPIQPELTGIDELEIGRTFVVREGKAEDA